MADTFEGRPFWKRMAGRIARIVRDICIVAGVLSFAFGAANGVAYLALPKIPPTPDNVFARVINPGSPQSLGIYKKMFGVSSDAEAMARIAASPKMEMHPTLPFMTERIDDTLFRIGVEGVRYEPGWDDARVKAILADSGRLVFCLGGSTLLGHGVSGDETVPFHLGKMLAGAPILNLGAQGYQQSAEIKKLIYLLQAGYRPKIVIFLDGWNDLVHLARSNMRSVDHFTFHSYGIKRGDVAFTPGTAGHRPDHWRLFLESLPLFRAIRAVDQLPRDVRTVKFDRDAFADGFEFQESDFILRHWAAYSVLHDAELKTKVVSYYRENLALLSALSRGYGFRLYVFFQPIGLTDPRNPFVPREAREAPGYAYIAGVADEVRARIADGTLPMIDISRDLESKGGPDYIDVAHYSPAGNQAVAARIAKHLGH